MAFTPCVWSGYYREYPIEECVDLFIKAGFSCTEMTIDHIRCLAERDDADAQARKIRSYLDSMNFSIPQGHLSFKNVLTNPDTVDILKREMELFAVIGVKNAVLHFNGGEKWEPAERMEKRLESLSKLKTFVQESDMVLCIENLGSVPETHTVERINEIIDTVGEENMGICLDTGHLHLVNGRGEAELSQGDFIRQAGKDLCAMHVTNNSGGGDDHLMPFSSRYGVDWKDVVVALREINYEGLFNLEILGENKAPMPILEAKLAYIAQMVRYMTSNEFANA